MRHLTAALISFLLLSTSAFSAPPQVVASIAALRAGNFGSYPNITLSSWIAGGTSGGGDLVLDASDITTADNACSVFVDAASHRFKRVGKTVGLHDCGAYGDGISVSSTGVSITGSALTITGAAFKSTDVGEAIQIPGAAAAGAVLYTTIAAYVSPTQVTVTTPASTTLSGVATVVIYGHDDETAKNNWLASASAAVDGYSNGAGLACENGNYLVDTTVRPRSGVSITAANNSAVPQQSISSGTKPWFPAALVNTRGSSVGHCVFVDNNPTTVGPILIDTAGIYTGVVHGASGTAQGSGTSASGHCNGQPYITLSAGSSAVDDFYNGGRLYITANTGVGQERPIICYEGATKRAAVGWPWNTLPDATSAYSSTAHVAGDQFTDQQSPSELSCAGSQAPAITYWNNGALRGVTALTLTRRGTGIRILCGAKADVANNASFGFNTGAEISASEYAPISNNTFVGFQELYALVFSDHLSVTTTNGFGPPPSTLVSPTASDMPWYVNWMAQTGLDVHSDRATGLYMVLDAASNITSSNAEEMPRGIMNISPNGTSFTGDHMEHIANDCFYNQVGGIATWTAGNVQMVEANHAMCGTGGPNLTITGLGDAGSTVASPALIGTFIGTGGKVVIRNTTPMSGDVQPDCQSYVVWDFWGKAPCYINASGGWTMTYESAVFKHFAGAMGGSIVLPLVGAGAAPPTANGRCVVVGDDDGDAATNNITVVAPSGTTLVGNTTITTNFGTQAYTYDGGSYHSISSCPTTIEW